jgi:hypothetical protein
MLRVGKAKTSMETPLVTLLRLGNPNLPEADIPAPFDYRK